MFNMKPGVHYFTDTIILGIFKYVDLNVKITIQHVAFMELLLDRLLVDN